MGIVKLDSSIAGAYVGTNMLLEHNDYVGTEFWNQFVTNVGAGYCLYQTALSFDGNTALTDDLYCQIPPTNLAIKNLGLEGTYVEYASIYYYFRWKNRINDGDIIAIYGGTRADAVTTLLGSFVTPSASGTGSIAAGTIICNNYSSQTKGYPYFIRLKGTQADRACFLSNIGVVYKKYPALLASNVDGVGTVLFNDSTGSNGTRYGSQVNGNTFSDVGTNGASFYQLGTSDGTYYLEIGNGSFVLTNSALQSYSLLNVNYYPKNYTTTTTLFLSNNANPCRIRLLNSSKGWSELYITQTDGEYTFDLQNVSGETYTSVGTGKIDTSGTNAFATMVITSPGGGNDINITITKGLQLTTIYYDFQDYIKDLFYFPWANFTSSGAGTSCVGIKSVTGSWTI